MMALTIPGEIITFYSYKGGVGRSMALANVACLLARRYPQKILMIDWDLEAPGLHWFFQKRSAEQDNPDLEFQQKIQDQPGLIDLFQELEPLLREAGEENTAKVMERFDLERYIISANVPELPNLGLLKAGRFDEDYSRRVNGFDWVGFYARSPHIFQLFAQRLRQEYQYILIDSRTGVTDTSGICTALMPQKLVTVFTPNRQSLTGVLETAQKATEYRKQSDDLHPLVVYPLPSRVETSETTLRSQWRNGTPMFPGYQPSFEKLFQRVYDLPGCSLEDYFDDVQIQHFARYSYGEEIAVLIEREGDRLSLTKSYIQLLDRLIISSLPWESEGNVIQEIERFQKERSRSEVYETVAPQEVKPGFEEAQIKQRFEEIRRGIDPEESRRIEQILEESHRLNEQTNLLLEEANQTRKSELLRIRFIGFITSTMLGLILISYFSPIADLSASKNKEQIDREKMALTVLAATSAAAVGYILFKKSER